MAHAEYIGSSVEDSKWLPVVDVTQEFLTLDRSDFSNHVRSLGDVVIGISFSLPAESDLGDIVLARKTKAFVERSPRNRVAALIASRRQVSLEPNVFSSGVGRIDPDTCLIPEA